MKVILLATAYALLSVATLADTTEITESQLSADQLLEDVVKQFPSALITVSGKLLVRRRRGMPVANYLFELKADWGKTPAQATYRIDDSFGSPLEQLTLTHGQQNSYQYSAGDPLQPSILKSLSSQIQKTDLTWTDLTLAFLWWRGGKVIGSVSERTVDCHIIKVQAPADATTPYDTVKIWISKKQHLMLKAEGYNAKNKLVRRLWIKNGQKINDEWMVKDMEIQQYPKKQITKLRVLDIQQQAMNDQRPTTRAPTP